MISVVKDTFLHESSLQRKCALTIPVFCECIVLTNIKASLYLKNILLVLSTIKNAVINCNSATTKAGFQMYFAVTNFEFIFNDVLTAEYSALLEPEANSLQLKSIDVLMLKSHEKNNSECKNHCKTADIISLFIL